MAKRLQKERLSLEQDVRNFLHKYENISNQLACICRSFESLEYLPVLTAVSVVIGIHLVEPFGSLTSSSKTTYDKLKTSFPQL